MLVEKVDQLPKDLLDESRIVLSMGYFGGKDS
jgi:hypothetical protein